MPTVTIRIGGRERDQLRKEAAARGVTLSELVRESLGLHGQDVVGRLDDMEKRLAAVERIAGLE